MSQLGLRQACFTEIAQLSCCAGSRASPVSDSPVSLHCKSCFTLFEVHGYMPTLQPTWSKLRMACLITGLIAQKARVRLKAELKIPLWQAA